MTSRIRLTLAANLKKLRLEKGLSQEALGFKCKVPDVYISKIERSILNVGVDNLEKIAKALGVKPCELLEEK